ncbi:hypothetical protein N657DRAFT_634478 [Parathielavia appendiculata]|uniref:Uncharacterized protein n=1 Tax=Parathielavia appendiculata TaxID=2587402 RepID=A0AAN6TYV7_9PEZI|nr:hypothetical protein N657DRAFT_634478 [Parathielavia appendiculata]
MAEDYDCEFDPSLGQEFDGLGEPGLPSFLEESFMEAHQNMNGIQHVQPGDNGVPDAGGNNTTATASTAPQVTADPVFHDPGLTLRASPVSQSLIDPALRDPSLALPAAPDPQAYQVAVESGGWNNQAYVDRDPQGQGNSTNQALTEQEAYKSTHGHSAYAMPPPPPPPPNNVPSATHQGMQPPQFRQQQLQQLKLLRQAYQVVQSQQPQFTQAMQPNITWQPFVPGNHYQQIGQSHQSVGLYVPQHGQPLHNLNQPVLPDPPVPVWQHAQPNQHLIQHKRRRKGSPGNDPSGRYTKPSGLSSWDPRVGKDKKDRLFQYYLHSAELRPGLTYTREQLVNFFLGTQNPNPNRQLTLWIQNTPAQSNDRYAAGGNSAKCRFEGCPARQNTIMKGFWRVAFDEFSHKTGKFNGIDPMQNAGYMHLHCFETAFDLGYLIHYGAARHGFRIAADTRQLEAETKNPMSITRDHGEMLETYNQWVDGQRARADLLEAQNSALPQEQWYTGFAPAADAIPPHPQRLGYALTVTHLNCEVEGRAKNREKRGGAHIGLHMGDLILHEQLKRQHAEKKRQAPQEPEAEETRHDRLKAEPEENTIVAASGTEPSRLTVPSGDPTLPGPVTRKRGRGEGQDQEGQQGEENLPDTRTPKRARQAADQIIEQLSSQPHVTRQTTAMIQSRLGEEPAVVRDRVLREVPPAYQPLFDDSLRNERLAGQISKLDSAQRRAVEHTVGKQEKEGRVLGEKKRKIQSM